MSAEELDRFAAVFGAGDVEAIMALMTEDCVFETEDSIYLPLRNRIGASPTLTF